MTELQRQFMGETGVSFDGIPINGVHLEYITWLEAQIQALRQPPVSGEVCDNCGDGKPLICAKCYETESNFRESY